MLSSDMLGSMVQIISYLSKFEVTNLSLKFSLKS
jgi:hypothetical protein